MELNNEKGAGILVETICQGERVLNCEVLREELFSKEMKI